MPAYPAPRPANVWYVFGVFALSLEACGARSGLELLDANAGSPAIRAAGGSNGAASGTTTGGAAGLGNIVSTGGNSTAGNSSGGARGIVPCPAPGSPNEAYDEISGSPCDEPDDFSCRGSDSCSRVCNCFPPPNNACESNAVPVWSCRPIATCGKPIACPFAGAVETAYNALAGAPCASQGAACRYCTCDLGNGALTWNCSLPACL